MRTLLALLMVTAVTGCYELSFEGDPLDPTLTQLDNDQLFSTAATYYDVPQDLLEVMAWHQSSYAPVWDHPDEEHHAHRPSYGWMGLTPEQIDLVADLTGAPTDALMNKREPNVMAGAVLLAHLRDEISPNAPSDHVDVRWWPVLTAWSDFGEEWLDHDWAREVMRSLQLGLEEQATDGQLVTIAPRRIAGLEDVEFTAPPMGEDEEARSTLGYPHRARFQAAHSSNQSSRSGGAGAINRIVIHTTEGSYNGAISWFRNSSSNVSAHYVLRRSDGEVTQMVGDDRRAWHACGNNNDTIGIEHEGTSYSSSQWTPAILDSSARLSAWLVQQYNIPIDRNHIVGHGEIQPDSCSGRSDPGSYFPWDDYLDMVASYAGGGSPAPEPEDPPETDGTPGPLTFIAPTAGASVSSPFNVVVQHPQSHIELWSGPALLVPYIFDHPAHHAAEFANGSRNLTARAYRASGSFVSARSIWVNVTDEVEDEPDPDPDPEPEPEPEADTDIDGVVVLPLGGSTLRFSSNAGGDVARVEYWIDGWRIFDDATGATSGTPSDYDLTYTFNYTGTRSLEAKAFDASGAHTDSHTSTIWVPDATPAPCPVDVCADSFPFTHSGNTSVSSLDAWDSYSCAPGTNESGPEIIYEVELDALSQLVVSVDDAYGVDVDVHILTSLSNDDCVARGHITTSEWLNPGTYYVVVDTWVNSSGIAFPGAYDLTVSVN